MRQNRRIASGLLLGLMLLGGGASGAPSRSSAFSGQCRGDGFQIDIVDLDVVRIHDPDERIEQLRDWTWRILLARLEASAGLDGLLDGNALQPLLRDDAYAHVLDHPVGNARSGIAGDGTVVAMIAQGNPAAMREALLEAVDQQALFLGATPRRAIAYRYALDERNAYVKLCRIGDLDAAWLEAEAQGFRRRTVRTPKELGTFLDGGVDLMTAQCTASGLEVTGRRRSRTGKAPITVEHVASLHQSIPRGDEASEELSWPWLLREKLGFSLDPEIRARDVILSIDALLAVLDDPSKLAALLYSWEVNPEDAQSFILWAWLDAFVGTPLERGLRDLRRALEQSSDTEALTLVEQSEVAAVLHQHDGYQCARYDGLRLQGTLTSMTLFYTDLLMKLWGQDQFDSAPEGLIPGFESEVGHELAAAHCTAEERQYRSTRSWLGLREEQYARAGGEEWRFAPVVTRVFAKSSEAGPEYGDEVEARADTQRFVRWWNARYGLIAAWEPQYELLNQLMKWSLVLQAARGSEHPGCLDFLDTVAVKRTHRFDTWVASTRELRWRGPVTLVHQEDEPTECLPILRSRSFSQCGVRVAWFGGVSLASRAQIASKRLPRQGHPSELRHLKALSHEQPRIGPDGRVTYPSLSRADGTLENVVIKPGKLFSARVDPARSQRGLRHIWSSGRDHGSRFGRSVKKWWNRVKGRLDVHAEIGGFGVGHLRADDLTGPVVRARITVRAVPQARALGEEVARRRASGDASLDEIMANLPDVSKAWRVDEETVLVELADAPNRGAKYGLMSSGGGIRGPPGAPTIRFGAGNGRALGRTVEIVLLRAAQAQQYQQNELAKGPVVERYHKLKAALARNDIPEATNIIGQIRAMDPMSHRLIMRYIVTAQGKAVREGKQTAALEKLLMREAIVHGRPTTPVREFNTMPADGTTFYVPRGAPRPQQYAELISLPPGVDPATPPSARLRFHARLVEEAARIASLPAKIPHPRGGAHSRGSDSRRSSGAGHAPDSRDDYHRYERRGALFGYPRRVYVIEPCEPPEEQDDASRQRGHGATSMPCHGRSAARHAEAEAQAQLLTVACEVEDPQYRKLVAKACKRLPARERNASPNSP